MPSFTGNGILGGTFPLGISTVEGTPTPVTVRVQYRAPGDPDDGAFVAEVVSEADGTWEITDLNEYYVYDVIGRYPDYNDIIVSNVTPWVYRTRISETGDRRVSESGDIRITE